MWVISQEELWFMSSHSGKKWLGAGRTFQTALVVKNLSANAEDIKDAGSIPGLGRSPGEGRGNPFQFSCLKNPMDRGDWRAIVHRVTHSRTQLKQLSTHAQGAQNGGRVCSLSAFEGQIRVKRIRQLGVRGQCSRSLRWSSVKSVYPYCESALTSLVLPFRLLFLCHFEGTGSLRF